MATRGSIPKIMEMAGIELLPPEAGVPTVRRELTRGRFRGEMVVAGRLGLMMQEFDETGGLDPVKAAQWIAERKLPMVGHVRAAKLYGGLEVETELDPRVQPFLHDHALEGTPLLPGVMGTEVFAQLASLLAPGYTVKAIGNERFESPFKFYRNRPRTLYLSAALHPLAKGELIAHTTLCSITRPPKPELPPQDAKRVHFTADVRLTREPLAAPRCGEGREVRGQDGLSREAIYRLYFHGPAYQVLERVWVKGNTAVGLMARNLPPNTSPADAASLMAPRLIELCFQTAGAWEIKTKGVMALPLGMGSVTAYRQPEDAGGLRLYARVEAVNDGESFNAQVTDEAGNVYVQINGYRTVPLPGNVTF
jgi:hypothetical protein